MTNGASGFKIDNEYKVTYNHYDSNPDGLGEDVVNFVKEVIKTRGGLNKLKRNVSKLKLVRSGVPASKTNQKKYKRYANMDVSTRKITEWYVLLRNAQGIDGIRDIYNGKLDIMINSLSFLRDSDFCEYAYIINLDENRLEFYEGGSKTPQLNSPLKLPQCPHPRKTSGDWYPVRFKGSCPLNRIPKNWKEKFYKEEE